MALFPVIMCGGAGTRLWPASRPSRPKQFIALIGERSLFQETLLRVAPLARDGGQLVIVGGAAHRDLIAEQLAELNLTAAVLLEPAPRDSAAAMAAAAAWVSARDPDGCLAVVASDHHLPDAAAFQSAVLEAADAARSGRIVTLGVRPTQPSSAYGYIRPTGRGLSDVAAFVEKPDTATAEIYLRESYLWNSGNFIVSANILLEELHTFAPEVEAAARLAVANAPSEGVILLGDAFLSAPKTSIDYAVMEKSRRVSVLEVDFHWSDLGSWDAIAGTGEGSTGLRLMQDADSCLVRAPEGVAVAVIGVRDVAVIVESDAVLVCALPYSQSVKRIVEELRHASPAHLDFLRPRTELSVGAVRLVDWLRTAALPVWATLGQAEDGRFAETLSEAGRLAPGSARARVPVRQTFVFARAGLAGWNGPWKRTVQTGLHRFRTDFRRADGLYRTLVDAHGEALDDTAMTYDQAFVLLALATASQAGVEDARVEAAALRDRLIAERGHGDGIRESGPHAYQANAHMHLLEASLAWIEVGADDGWRALADRIVRLALERFIDGEGGFLREHFDADWRPAAGDDGRLVEPGHQFEWAWLMARYGRMCGSDRATAAAARLYDAGLRGVRGTVAVDACNDDGSTRSERARLWPQTEWLKAALILAEGAAGERRAELLEDAAAALSALWIYLEPNGVWKDKRLPGGAFVEEAAPASSLYHIMAAYLQLADTDRVLGLSDQGLALA